MRALILERPRPAGENPLVGADLADPTPAPGELLLRVSACAVCRTDLQLAEGDIPARRLPVVPGHQAVGTVEAVGPGVSGWQPGERAGVAWLGSTCGSCRHCRSGSENLCPNARFTGWDLDGGFAELVTVRADFALRMPSAFSDVDGAPLLCGGVIGYRALKLTGIERGGRLGLFGFGASARLTIQVAVHRGYEVHVWTRSRVERERAIELGATWTGGYDKAPPSQLDAAITFAPSGDVVVAALGALAPGGSVVVNAIHLDRIPEFRYELLWSERVLRSVANFTREDAREFLTIAPAIPIRTEVDRFSLADGNEALRRVAAGRIRGAAVLIPA